jgi:hypothetical protein
LRSKKWLLVRISHSPTDQVIVAAFAVDSYPRHSHNQSSKKRFVIID